jgi:hypothetical protein
LAGDRPGLQTRWQPSLVGRVPPENLQLPMSVLNVSNPPDCRAIAQFIETPRDFI